MEDTAPLIEVTRFQCEIEPITHIITALTQIVNEQNELTWMSQPDEKAVYVHVSESSFFLDVSVYMKIVTEEINEILKKSSIVGSYYCHADASRNCLDLYYQRY